MSRTFFVTPAVADKILSRNLPGRPIDAGVLRMCEDMYREYREGIVREVISKHLRRIMSSF